MIQIIMLYLGGQVQMSEDDFVAAGSNVSFDDLVTHFDPVTADLQNMLNGLNDIVNQAPQMVKPIAADISYLQMLLDMHRDAYTKLISDAEPTDSKEAYLRALYQLPVRLYRIMQHMQRLMAALKGNTPDDDGDDD